jgi:hypothetical protein
MQQLTKSLGSFTWAMSLFGVQQMTNALRVSRDSGANKAVEALDEVTRASIEQCGTTMRETFDMGDKLQREMIDLMFGVVSFGGSRSAAQTCSCTSPMDMMRGAPGVARSAASAAQPSAAPEEELGWGPVPPVA